MIRLADPAGSKAILMGTARYQDPKLGDIPAVADNLADLKAILTDPGLGGLHRDNVKTILDPTHSGNPGLSIADVCDEAEDVLLVYFAGHGLIGTNRELRLALSDTTEKRKDHTSLSIEQVRTAISTSPARIRILILDCCYSGRGLGQPMAEQDASTQVLNEINVEGMYSLASASRDITALFVPGERHTMFTGELIRLLREGIADDSPLLALSTIYHQLIGRLRARSGPTPRALHSDTVNNLALVRNKGYRPGRPARPQPPVQPQPAVPPVRLRTPTEADEFIRRLDVQIPKGLMLTEPNLAVSNALGAAARDTTWPVLARLRFACLLSDIGANDRAAAAIYALGGGQNPNVVQDVRRLRNNLTDDDKWSKLYQDHWVLNGLVPRHHYVADFDPVQLWGTVMAMLLAEAGLPSSIRLRAIGELVQLGYRGQAVRIAQGMLRERRIDPALASGVKAFLG